MKKYIYFTIAACAVLLFNLQSCKKSDNNVILTNQSATFVLKDASDKVMEYVDPSLLLTVQNNLVKNGMNFEAAQLILQYDFNTGYLKSLGKKEAKENPFKNAYIDSSKIPHSDTIFSNKSKEVWHQNGVWADGWIQANGLQSGILQVSNRTDYTPATFVGTTGKSLRLESYRLRCDSALLNIQYDIMFPNGTWFGYNGVNPMWNTWVGTQGQSQTTSAIRLWFVGSSQPHFHIYYRSHLSGTGWGIWYSDGAISGSQGVRLEAFAYQILKY